MKGKTRVLVYAISIIITLLAIYSKRVSSNRRRGVITSNPCTDRYMGGGNRK